eukprot:2282954-Ditylum_brightwellii.AAC.1
MDTMHVSTSGVYSNGKDFVLRGGPHFKKPELHEVNAIHTLQSSADPSSAIIREAEPLRLDYRDGLSVMSACTSNSDCIMGACGHTRAGGNLVCCPEGETGLYG